MHPRFYEAVMYLYPKANPFKDFMLQDNSDGKGVFLKTWNLPGDPPTDDQIDALVPTLDGIGIVPYATMRLRFTDDERAAISKACQTTWQVDDFMRLAAALGRVDLTDPVTVQAKAMLVQLGLLTQDRVDAVFVR